MLRNTFIHIPHVSEMKEQELWKKGIVDWESFLKSDEKILHHEFVRKYVELSLDNYKNHEFFSDRLMSRYHWRAYDDFKDRCCFLDIETTGLDKRNDDITVIGLYDGNKSKVFVNGKNLDDFKEEIGKYSFIVTFNGLLFDMPFIRAKFPDMKSNQLHADLRFVLRQLGYSGGLKNIEKEFGIEREGDLKNMNGLDAVHLWHQYKRYNDKKALDKLIRYNIEDIENLKILMETGYSELKKKKLLI
jgi:uncharacterized protein